MVPDRASDPIATMTPSPSLQDQVLQWADTLTARVMALLPGLLGAVLLLVGGWAAARLLRALSQRLLHWADGALGRVLGPGRAARIRLGRSAPLVGGLVFWTVLLFFAVAATQALGLQAFTALMIRLLDQLPTVLAGLLIIVAGFIVARLLADLILGAAQLPQAQRVGAARAVQVAIVAGAVLVGADQMGVKVTFLAIFAGAVAAAVAGGAVMALSLGARHHVANLIGAQQIRPMLTPGQRIRVAGCEGRVLEIDSQRVLLETADGRVSLPGHLFSQHPVEMLERDDEATEPSPATATATATAPGHG
jgi:hypothetical protein